MSVPLVAAVLVAAVLHAVWNAIAKGVADRLGLFLRSSLVYVAAGLVSLWWVAPPARAALPWLTASAVVHVGYSLGLVAAYRLGDFNLSYPLARGLGPLIVAVVAVTVVGETLPLTAAAGIVLISGAVVVLGLSSGGRPAVGERPQGGRGVAKVNGGAVVAAAVTGVAIAAYTLLDGIGVRRSGSPVGYTAWLMGLHGVVMVATVGVVRWRAGRGERTPVGWGAALAVGGLSLSAYGLVLWAQTRGALASVAALREFSVVVAAGIGVVVFREPLGRVRTVAGMAVAVGVVLLAAS